ncbi:MAG TPA: BamA/TamA family outer membrane protein [Opitutaceae bacterium]|nr:BamA/TamA family outer membrane protein [Opitutaceae bacterium]
MRRGAWALMFALAWPAAAAAAGRATIEVQGIGWWHDHTLRNALVLLLGDQRGATLRADGIEDAALIVYSTLGQGGYLQPTVRVRTREADGRVRVFTLDPDLARPLPRPLAAVDVVFLIRKGVRYDIDRVAFHGLTVLSRSQALPYFRAEGLLASMAAERIYSPDRLHRSAENLQRALQDRGYSEATVTARETASDPRTGKVGIVVDVHEGPLWRVTGLDWEVTGAGPRPPNLEARKTGVAWNDAWRHNAEADVRRWYYQRGYPDVHVGIAPRPAPPLAGERAVTVVAHIRTGSYVRLGRVRFEGDFRTHLSVLEPLVKAKPGAALNPLQIQDAEYRISRLGVFSGVTLRYEPADGPVRDAVYVLSEGKRQDVDLLAGWGSYEELRGGVEWHNYNLWNLAHEGMLKFVQSLKSTEAEYDYTIPELGGSDADLTGKLFGFRRDERSFIDEQYGATVALTTPLKGIGWDLLTGYTFDRLKAENDTLATVLSDITNANATSVQATLTRNRLDHPLLPRHGYKVSLEAEEASRYLGGQVDFQQFEVTGSYHTSWGSSRWIHLGFTHGMILTYGGRPGEALPPNIFFYPGGEDSIRGYAYGQASPRDPVTGQFLPAKTETLLNLELEQALTSKWSAVLFNDDLGASASMSHYPWDYRLYTIGVGISYRTIVGPLRLEYGRNLNPRPHDPQGTVLFSVGFPF